MRNTRRTLLLIVPVALFLVLAISLSQDYSSSQHNNNQYLSLEQTSKELVLTVVKPQFLQKLADVNIKLYIKHFNNILVLYLGNLVTIPFVSFLFIGFLVISFLFVLLILFIHMKSENAEQGYMSVPTTLAEKLIECFNIEELKLLCFELNIDYEDICGESKTLKIHELIGFCKRRGRLQELIERAKRNRPHVSWP